MSKPSLSPLTAIPIKGQAARPELIPETTAGHEVAERSIGASIPAVLEEARSTVTVRLPIPLLERLREMSHRRRQLKQDIIGAALDLYMKEHGF
jgi:hypothetical protein